MELRDANHYDSRTGKETVLRIIDNHMGQAAWYNDICGKLSSVNLVGITGSLGNRNLV
ncbi:hypothetical protein [Aquitalea aquatilis]|uniref:hypothetical protein n=1 Tax=Aquitalea aquatilis TaxID=1537400 RepID=UPI00143DAC79|nr:hypothetical protein [Aquitalea aquatilis]